MNREKVLIIEDHADTRELLHVMLTREGIESIGVGTFAEARAQIRSSHYGLYLMDSRIPDGLGFEFCREIRSQDSRTPIVFYSALAHAEEKQEGLEAGANAYFVKPLEFTELLAELKRLLRSNIHQAAK